MLWYFLGLGRFRGPGRNYAVTRKSITAIDDISISVHVRESGKMGSFFGQGQGKGLGQGQDPKIFLLGRKPLSKSGYKFHRKTQFIGGTLMCAALRHRVVLDVPYAEKNEAKELGAWWDPHMRKWFVPPGRDPQPFARWFPKQEAEFREECENHS